MSLFALKKKRYRFNVDLCLEELSEVSYAKGVLFAKIRQVNGGSFTDVSKRSGLLSFPPSSLFTACLSPQQEGGAEPPGPILRSLSLPLPDAGARVLWHLGHLQMQDLHQDGE